MKTKISYYARSVAVVSFVYKSLITIHFVLKKSRGAGMGHKVGHLVKYHQLLEEGTFLLVTVGRPGM